MAALKGSKTEDNLKAAFAGESQANRRYLYFARKADVEGYNDVAAVFRSTAEGETGHAHGHLEYLEESGDPATGLPIGATNNNLAAAVAICIAVGSVTISPMTLALLDLAKVRSADDGRAASPVRKFFGAVGNSVRKPIFVGPMIGIIVSLIGWIALVEGLLMMVAAQPLLILFRPVVGSQRAISLFAILFGIVLIVLGLTGRADPTIL